MLVSAASVQSGALSCIRKLPELLVVKTVGRNSFVVKVILLFSSMNILYAPNVNIPPNAETTTNVKIFFIIFSLNLNLQRLKLIIY